MQLFPFVRLYNVYALYVTNEKFHDIVCPMRQRSETLS